MKKEQTISYIGHQVDSTCFLYPFVNLDLMEEQEQLQKEKGYYPKEWLTKKEWFVKNSPKFIGWYSSFFAKASYGEFKDKIIVPWLENGLRQEGDKRRSEIKEYLKARAEDTGRQLVTDKLVKSVYAPYMWSEYEGAGDKRVPIFLAREFDCKKVRYLSSKEIIPDELEKEVVYIQPMSADIVACHYLDVNGNKREFRFKKSYLNSIDNGFLEIENSNGSYNIKFLNSSYTEDNMLDFIHRNLNFVCEYYDETTKRIIRKSMKPQAKSPKVKDNNHSDNSLNDADVLVDGRNKDNIKVTFLNLEGAPQEVTFSIEELNKYLTEKGMATFSLDENQQLKIDEFNVFANLGLLSLVKEKYEGQFPFVLNHEAADCNLCFKESGDYKIIPFNIPSSAKKYFNIPRNIYLQSTGEVFGLEQCFQMSSNVYNEANHRTLFFYSYGLYKLMLFAMGVDEKNEPISETSDLYKAYLEFQEGADIESNPWNPKRSFKKENLLEYLLANYYKENPEVAKKMKECLKGSITIWPSYSETMEFNDGDLYGNTLPGEEQALAYATTQQLTKLWGVSVNPECLYNMMSGDEYLVDFLSELDVPECFRKIGAVVLGAPPEGLSSEEMEHYEEEALERLLFKYLKQDYTFSDEVMAALDESEQKGLKAFEQECRGVHQLFLKEIAEVTQHNQDEFVKLWSEIRQDKAFFDKRLASFCGHGKIISFSDEVLNKQEEHYKGVVDNPGLMRSLGVSLMDSYYDKGMKPFYQIDPNKDKKGTLKEHRAALTIQSAFKMHKNKVHSGLEKKGSEARPFKK